MTAIAKQAHATMGPSACSSASEAIGKATTHAAAPVEIKPIERPRRSPCPPPPPTAPVGRRDRQREAARPC